MNEMIAKIIKTKSWFFEKIILINHYPESSRKKGRRPKSVELEMKKDKKQLTLQKQMTMKTRRPKTYGKQQKQF